MVPPALTTPKRIREGSALPAIVMGEGETRGTSCSTEDTIPSSKSSYPCSTSSRGVVSGSSTSRGQVKLTYGGGIRVCDVSGNLCQLERRPDDEHERRPESQRRRMEMDDQILRFPARIGRRSAHGLRPAEEPVRVVEGSHFYLRENPGMGPGLPVCE